jgi:membrane protein insertase Oxa1/YidC/SpoIIIJ
MYHSQHDRGQEQRMRRPQQSSFFRSMRSALPVLTVVFWAAAAIFVVLLAVPSFIGSLGAWLSLLTGISLLVVVLSSGAIAWVEFRSNPTEDAERGEWTNKMLFYGLVFAITFFVAFLYWLSLYFAS